MIDVCWFVALAFFTVTYIVIDVFAIIRYEKQIKLLEERVKAWGECAYAFGYNDGVRARKAQPKTQEDVLAEIKEKENADQNF